jgi:predicted outer membrane lipoprotein
MQPSWFSFLIYFILLTNSVYPENLIIAIIIINNNSLRTLSNIEGKCTLQGSGTEVKGQYLCEVEADTSNINQIKIGNYFKFDSEDNVTVSGITPIANMYMDNIQDIGNKFANLDNSTIYVLEHSVYKKYGNLLFNITGTINDPQANITDDDFVLMMNGASYDKTQIEVNCNIADIIGNNYTLNCKSNENIKGDLQSAISFIDDDILIINFDGITDGEVELETSSTSRFYRKKRGGLNAGAIVGIILACAVAIISAIAVMVYCKKENHNKHGINESTIIKINEPKVDSTKILN